MKPIQLLITGLLLICFHLAAFIPCPAQVSPVPVEVAGTAAPQDDTPLSFSKSAAWVDENWEIRYDTILLVEGERAPDLTLHTTAGVPFNLYEELEKGKPVLLISGSHSCPVARGNLNSINELTTKYQARMTTAMVYTIEAHPVDTVSPYSITNEVWLGKANVNDGVLIEKPTTYRERRAVCDRWQSEFGLEPLVLVDNPENEFWLAYGQAPNMAYLIGPDKTIVGRQLWFNADALQEKIDGLLD